LIEIGVLSLLINIKTYSVDRNWSCINLINTKTYQVDRNWSSITVDKYPRHIKLIEFGDISMLIEIGDIIVEINIRRYFG
jgi:hypothetical protein